MKNRLVKKVLLYVLSVAMVATLSPLLQLEPVNAGVNSFEIAFDNLDSTQGLNNLVGGTVKYSATDPSSGEPKWNMVDASVVEGITSEKTDTGGGEQAKLMYRLTPNLVISQIWVKVEADENKAAFVQKDSSGSRTNVSETTEGSNIYPIDIGSRYYIEFRDRPAGQESSKLIDINIVGGEKYKAKSGDTINIGNLDIDNFNFYIDKLYNNTDDSTGIQVTNCNAKEYTPDSQGRNPLEIRTISKTGASWTVNLEYHGEPNFYLTNITFYCEGANLIQITGNERPYMFDNMVVTDKAFITGTTKDAPAEFRVYYGGDEITLEGVSASGSGDPATINEIEVMDDITDGAIIITGNSIKFNSPYYNSVLFKVTMSDNTVGYIRIIREGIEISEYNLEDKIFHGSQQVRNHYLNPSLSSIVASFYYNSDSNEHPEYSVISNITFKNGSVKTFYGKHICWDKLEDGSGEENSNIKVCDYFCYSRGNCFDTTTPIKVSVIVTKKDAVKDPNNFGGASLGTGAGVTKNFDPNRGWK